MSEVRQGALHPYISRVGVLLARRNLTERRHAALCHHLRIFWARGPFHTDTAPPTLPIYVTPRESHLPVTPANKAANNTLLNMVKITIVSERSAFGRLRCVPRDFGNRVFWPAEDVHGAVSVMGLIA